MTYMHPAYHGGKNHPEQVTDEYLTCGLCHIPGFKQPKQLQCGHTFCLPCLERRVQNVGGASFSCPSCARVNIVPRSGLGGLSDNLFIDTQVDRLVRRHNQDRGRDDTWYNISCYGQDFRGHASLKDLN